MSCYIQNIRSELYKMTHSSQLLIHLLIPLAGAGIFLAYDTTSPWAPRDKISAYLQCLSIAFPFLIGLIVAITFEQEQNAGSFQQLLSVAGRKWIPHFSKLVSLLLCGLLASGLAVYGFGIAFRLMGNRQFPMTLFGKAGLILFAGALPLYLLEYVLCFTFGKGVGVGFGMVGSLLSSLLLTGLGDGIWPFTPWSVAGRLCDLLVDSQGSSAGFIRADGVKDGLFFLAIISALLLFLCVLWSEKWEGGKKEED